jgi:hypothetical protein
MKTISLNTKSWHWRLATVYKDFNPHATNSNLCDYTKHVILGFTNVMWIILFAGIYAVCLADTTCWLLAGLVVGTLAEPAIGGFCVWVVLAPAIIVGLVALVTGIVVGKEYASEFIEEFHATKEPFYYLWYKSVKDKVCYRVNFK